VEKSTHRVEVIPVHLEKHPNADTLSIVKVFGYTVCVRTADWADGRLGAYIPPDSVCPDTPQFAFLGERKRVKVKKLRGIISMGLLVPAPEGAKEGDDVAVLLNIAHYEPPENASTGGDNEVPPPGYRPNYDVDTWRRYKHLFFEGELVVATEKIHGASGRWSFVDGRMHCGSRTCWKKEDEKNLWWKALKQNPWIEGWCRAHEGLTLYGEVFGNVQDLKYGTRPGLYRVAIFDILEGSQWWPADLFRAEALLEKVPLLYQGPYQAEMLEKMAEGPSLVDGADHLREGLVLKPANERTDPEIGRVQLKIVSNAYLER